jgi:hypothetical protein
MPSIPVFFALILFAFPFCVPQSDAASSVELSGKVADDNRLPVSGMHVEAWPAGSLALAGEAPHRSAPTDEQGHFTLTLPQGGDYYLLARGEGRFGYYGRNPVRVSSAGLAGVTFGVKGISSGGFDLLPEISQGILGRVVHRGKPVAGTMIHVYLDPSSGFKGMGFAVLGPTDEEGMFEAQLPVGTYYLVARLRRDGSMVGPLRAGDFIGYWNENPLRVETGQVQRAAISLQEVPDKVVEQADHLFGDISLSGRVVDQQGRPVAGLRVLLYDNPRMLDRPLFVSQPTDADGAYVLSFPEPGRYYLRARSNIGGEPVSGELMGDYMGTDGEALKVETGDHLQGIDIKVEALW